MNVLFISFSSVSLYERQYTRIKCWKHVLNGQTYSEHNPNASNTYIGLISDAKTKLSGHRNGTYWELFGSLYVSRNVVSLQHNFKKGKF